MKYTDDQILDLFEKSSQEIQDTLSSQELLDFLAELRKTHALHVDALGKIAELIRNLLLGITGPADYYNELVLSGMTPEVAQNIVMETNDRIFIPLRNRIQSKTPTPIKGPLRGAPAQIPSPPPINKKPVATQALPHQPAVNPIHVEAAPQTQVFTSTGGWPGAPAGNWQPAAAVHVYVPGPAPAHPVAAPAPVVAQPAAIPVLPQPTQPLAPSSTVPTPASQTPVARPIPTPPQNLPGAPVSQNPPIQPIEKNYVADPYREPPV